MKISDNTSVSMPMRNLLSILGATALGVWAYFGVIERTFLLSMKESTASLALVTKEFFVLASPSEW